MKKKWSCHNNRITCFNSILWCLLSWLDVYWDDSVPLWSCNGFSPLPICRVNQSNTSWTTWIVLVNWWVTQSSMCKLNLTLQFINCQNLRPCQNYIPSKQDILFARKATKGIVEHDFVIKKIPFKMVDVGGQRSQRQKWFQCFDGITSILFMVSSSEYDQVAFKQTHTFPII